MLLVDFPVEVGEGVGGGGDPDDDGQQAQHWPPHVGGCVLREKVAKLWQASPVIRFYF